MRNPVRLIGERQRLTGSNGKNFALTAEPDGRCRRVVDEGAVQREEQVVVGIHVVIYLDVRGVPHVLAAAHFFSKVLDALPVVLSVQLIGVSPDIKQRRTTERGSGKKAVRKLKQTRVVVMTGRGEGQPVLRHVERMGAVAGATVDDAAGAERFQRVVVVGTESVGAAAHQGAEQHFQFASVARNLFQHLGFRQIGKPRVPVTMQGDLHAAVTVKSEAVRLRHSAMDGTRRVDGPLGCKATGVDIECTFKPVVLHDADQAAVGLHAVIITHGQGAG